MARCMGIRDPRPFSHERARRLVSVSAALSIGVMAVPSITFFQTAREIGQQRVRDRFLRNGKTVRTQGGAECGVPDRVDRVVGVEVARTRGCVRERACVVGGAEARGRSSVDSPGADPLSSLPSATALLR